MLDYYYYLWSTTWPYMVVLFLIWGFVVFRVIGKCLDTWRFAWDAWGLLTLVWTIIIWVGILGIYTKLLLFSQPDWLAQPSFIEGTVQKKTYDSGLRSYSLGISSDSELKQLYIDQKVYEQIKVKDHVKLMYLPVRREVVRLELIVNLP